MVRHQSDARCMFSILSCLRACAMSSLLLTVSGAFAHASQSSTQNPGEPSSADPATLVSIVGHVVDALSREPLRQANLTLTVLPGEMRSGGRGRRPPRFGTTTDAQGKFDFANLPPGRYQLEGEKTGYVRSSYSGNRGQDRAPLEGKPGQKITGIEFSLMPQAIIAGRVLDEFGEPVANARVRLQRQTGYFRQTTGGAGGGSTNAIGEFLLGGLAPGRYMLEASNRPGRFGRGAAVVADEAEGGGYVTTYYPGTTEADAAAAIIVGAGQQVRGIDVWLQRGKLFRVTGQVSGVGSADGANRFRIVIQPESGSPMSGPGFRNVSTSADGSFEVSGVQSGSYVLTAILNTNNGRPQMLGSVPVIVTDRDVEGIVIPGTPHDPLTIPGKITMEGASGPTPRAAVSLQRLGPSIPFFGSGNARTLPDGTFTIENVPAGKYAVQVTLTDSSAGYLKRITAGGTDVQDGVLDLSQPQAMPPLEILISPKAATIEGIVLEGDEPQPDAYVTLLPDPLPANTQRLRMSATADASGHFSFQGVAPGDYRLYGWQERFPLRVIEAADLVPYQSYGVGLSVEESDREQVDLRIVPLP